MPFMTTRYLQPLRLTRVTAALSRRGLTTLGIRREDPARIWERRAPLTPQAVSKLLQDDDVRVEIEACQRRCFPNELYNSVGAKVVPRLSKDVDVVIGIKEPHVNEVKELIADGKERKWMMFSHTHKGQAYNTPLLASFLRSDSPQTLIDHELLAAPSQDGKMKRVAAFGWFAGAVGAGEAISMTGLALLKRGIATPLLQMPRPYTFPNLKMYKEALKNIGKRMKESAIPEDGPIIIGLTGSGLVSSGAKAMLEEMGAEFVKAEKLAKLAERRGDRTIYACAIPPSAYFVRDNGEAFSKEDYYANPDSYRSTFSSKIAPYLTTLINGAGWQTGYPRIMKREDVDTLPVGPNGPKLVAIQDVTCDLEGNLGFVDKHTTIDQPHYLGPAGILISTIDILPTELALDASKHFSDCIFPYVQHILSGSQGGDSEVSRTVKQASIAESGQLTKRHQWLQPMVNVLSSTGTLPTAKAGGGTGSKATQSIDRRSAPKSVLLLGSGLVAGPAVDVLAGRSDVRLVIASNNAQEAQGLVRDRQNVATLLLDVSDREAVRKAVSHADIVVSLLPAPMHVDVAKLCIAHGKHLVTASYISPEMKELDKSAVRHDVVLLGECGLDPGIDSMAAMRIMNRVKREGKTVSSFVSWCGGLPEPSASKVPLGYKFSWSPRAVLTAALNDAKFKLDRESKEIRGQDLLAQHLPNVDLWDDLSLEGLANRDSMPYADKYGLGPVESLKDLFRGTLRYKGFSRLLDSFRRLGLLQTEPLSTAPTSWEELLLMCTARVVREEGGLKAKDLSSAVRDVLSRDKLSDTVDALTWLSLLPRSKKGDNLPALPTLRQPAPIDYFAHLLSHKLAYQPGERDMALLHHAFTVKAPNSEQAQRVTASLRTYGGPEGSAMSLTVGKTLAFAALRVLDGHVKARGVVGPYDREVWEGVLDDLEEVGIKVEEKWA